MISSQNTIFAGIELVLRYRPCVCVCVSKLAISLNFTGLVAKANMLKLDFSVDKQIP